MIELISEHLGETMIALGIIMLAIEVAILGFATFIMFFVGLSLVMTGSAIWLGLLPDTLNSILLSNAIVSSVLAILLWKPLTNLQNHTEKKDVNNDFIGVRFITEQAVSKKGLSQHKYSGITWTLKSDTEISAGSEVEIIKAEVGTLWVKAV